MKSISNIKINSNINFLLYISFILFHFGGQRDRSIVISVLVPQVHQKWFASSSFSLRTCSIGMPLVLPSLWAVNLSKASFNQISSISLFGSSRLLMIRSINKVFNYGRTSLHFQNYEIFSQGSPMSILSNLFIYLNSYQFRTSSPQLETLPVVGLGRW